MTSDLIADISRDVFRGNVALWLGSDWVDPVEEEDLHHITSVSWLAVWSEPQSERFPNTLKERWKTDSALARRTVIEVPGRREESLGSYFSFADICPVFFLRGRGNSWQTLPEREQRRARDEQIDEIGRLGSSLLLVCGYSNGEAVFKAIHDEFPPSAAVRILVCGLSETEEQRLVTELLRRSSAFSARLRVFSGSLPSLLRAVRALQPDFELPTPSIRAGTKTIDLAPVLEREQPIDQHFTVLTTHDTRPPLPDEDPDSLVENLLSSSTPPWRTFANDLHWHRNDHIVQSVFEYFPRPGQSAFVTCLNIPAEPGSGLTVLLSEIAFNCAARGYPALLCRTGPREIDYEALRTFLEYLTSVDPDCPPPVIVFDDSDNGFDTAAGLRELPVRLARDGRHALVVRGVLIRSSEPYDDSFRRSRGISGGSGRVIQHWHGGRLTASLTSAEQDSLCSWAGQHWPGTSAADLRHVVQGWGADWTLTGSPPPLLISLYFLLRDRVTHSTALGEHIVARLRHVLTQLPQAHGEAPSSKDATAKPFSSREELASAVARLRAQWRGEAPSLLEAAPTREQVTDAFLVLSVLGCLRIPVSYSLLAAFADVPTERLMQVTTLLDKTDLVRPLASPLEDELHGMWARDAFYTTVETIGLRHPSYGRLAIEWLRSESGLRDDVIPASTWLRELRSYSSNGAVEDYPIHLLEPVLRRIRPIRSDLDFVETISVRLLRLQRVRGSRYHEWLFRANQADTLLTVFASMPEQVARQSSVIMHSRGMTRYKSCSRSRPLAQCRDRYEEASADLQLAFERAQTEHRGEQPANVITSHGLLYLGWSKQEQERQNEGGDPAKARELAELARRYLREGLRLRYDNPYAAYGIAESLIYECERAGASMRDADYAAHLTEALDLLEMEPEPAFEEEWEDLKVRAIDLLRGPLARRAVDDLKARGDELGYALQALRILGGEIPYGPTADPHAVQRIRAALEELDRVGSPLERSSRLAEFLRYVLFSALPERLTDPSYRQRFGLIARLEGSTYLERPLWLYDYGMLALNNEKYMEASQAFRQLRKGGRFLEVPLDRACWFAAMDRPLEPRTVTLRVLSTGADGKGWARVEDPRGFKDPVSFPERPFVAAGSPTRPGAILRGRLRIRPAGPLAEPLR